MTLDITMILDITINHQLIINYLLLIYYLFNNYLLIIYYLLINYLILSSHGDHEAQPWGGPKGDKNGGAGAEPPLKYTHKISPIRIHKIPPILSI